MSSSMVAQMERDGYAVVPDCLPVDLLRRVLATLDALLCSRFDELTLSLPERVDVEIHEKLRHAAGRDRATLALVYDAIRKSSAFWQLIGHPSLLGAAETLLATDAVGVAFRGAGIRLDLPHEDRWRSEWHQEYHAQLTSMRGVVAWFPFVDVDAQMGPVSIACGSHHQGLRAVECPDPLNLGRDYTKSLRIPDAERLASQYAQVAPEVRAGDVVFIDFLTLHASGFNRSERSRITGQVRFGDLLHASSVRIGWKGGMHEGGDFAALHPEYVIAKRADQ